MTYDEGINLRNLMNKALDESFKKMVERKKKLGQKIVTVDKDGNPIELTAEEVENMID